MAHPYLFPAQDEVPATVSTETGFVGTVLAHNPGAAGAYVKLFQGTAAPTVASDEPAVSVWVAATSSEVVEVNADFGGGCWLAVTTQAGAGATGPASDFIITVIHGRA